mmetsp:Transcript_42210/g.101577  ORF Transcript_42210/g.101577 Transcript_42210/m.101577 type:complete len:86 (+) Transcript_42210:1805-2062(+)
MHLKMGYQIQSLGSKIKCIVRDETYFSIYDYIILFRSEIKKSIFSSSQLNRENVTPDLFYDVSFDSQHFVVLVVPSSAVLPQSSK